MEELGAHGRHLDSKALGAAAVRPVTRPRLLAVSGHTEALRHREAIGADFAVLSPTKFTKAHPDVERLG